MQEEWTTAILLQALADGKYEWLCKQFITMLMNKDAKLSSNNIIKRLEAEAKEAHTNENRSMQEAALATRYKNAGHHEKKKMKCTNPNCLKTCHTIEKCWEKGGGAEGKAPDWYKEMKGKKQCEKGHTAVQTPDTHSTGSKSLAAFIDDTAPKKQDNKRHLKLDKHFQGRNTDGYLSCIAKDTCMVKWNIQNTCNLKSPHPYVHSPSKNVASSLPTTTYSTLTQEPQATVRLI